MFRELNEKWWVKRWVGWGFLQKDAFLSRQKAKVAVLHLPLICFIAFDKSLSPLGLSFLIYQIMGLDWVTTKDPERPETLCSL